MRQILLLSRVNTTNLGDQLIGRSMVSLFSKYGEITQSDICSSSKQRPLKTEARGAEGGNSPAKPVAKSREPSFLQRAKWIYRNGPVFSVLKRKYDLIVIGGGELCSESFAFALSVWALLIRLFQKKAKVVLFGVGATSVEGKARKQLNRIIQLCDCVYVRDSASVKKVKELYGREAEEIPDVAFANDFHCKCLNSAKRIALYGMTTAGRLAKHHYVCSNERDYWCYSLEQIKSISLNGYRVQLFYTTRDDYESCRKFKSFCHSEFGVDIDIADINNLDDLMRIVYDADSVYSPRMHACIIGVLNNCEVHPIVISEKMRQFETKYNQVKPNDIVNMRQHLIRAVNEIVAIR